MIALLLRLYPARWRARYGDEFTAVLEERPLGPFDAADILLGALDAHLHLRGLGAASEHGRGFAMSLRLGGYAAIGGVVLLIIGLAASSADGSDEASPWLALVLAGNVLLLVALVGLSAFQAREYPRLVWAAFLVPAAGTIIASLGLAGMSMAVGDQPWISDLSPWEIWMIGLLALIGGSGLFAIATWLASSLSRAGTIGLGIAAATLLLSVTLSVVGGLGEAPGFVLFLAGILCFTGGWILLGISAIRTGRPVSVPTAGAPA
jgi:hypothetical protein